ncbi:hypothetical protein C1C98_30425 [Pseudomonas ogarae]|uniref:Uncharacterized protein n=1 Tax=Pseudomonas ogarae (strain DSM 112162 / CECT 30235 / F113) TaxID=1114970 RepID=A0ABN5GFY5_PSEO1|nr:hypothetical protein C1C98_30425 [Pseudomonas ogarae]
MYEHYLLRTLKPLSCGHNLARTCYWNCAARSCCVWLVPGHQACTGCEWHDSQGKKSPCSKVVRMLRNAGVGCIC